LYFSNQKKTKRSSSLSTNVGFKIWSLLYIPNQFSNKEQICIGGNGGQIQLYEIQQQQINLIQKFPKEHSSHDFITSLIQINSNTLVSASYSTSSLSPSDNVIVIWSKSKSSSSLYEPIQRITREETGGNIWRLVIINQKKEEEEEFASCSYDNKSIIIWRRRKGEGEEFRIKQKIENVKGVVTLLYIPHTNELIFGSFDSSLLQIWSTSTSSSFDFVEKQKIQISSDIWSLCQINKNDTKSRRIEFASGHDNGQVMIWSKQHENESKYSLIRTLKPFNNYVYDLIFINDNRFNFLVACCFDENKIKIFKGEGGEEELEHERVRRLIPMSNGQFASGGFDLSLNIWSPSF